MPKSAPADSSVAKAGQALVDKLLTVGIAGAGPFKGAAAVADEALASAKGDEGKAIRQLIATHVRLAGVNGFATGIGGIITLPVSVPASVTGFYLLATRMTASIAHVRGYDIQTEHVRSTILVAILGSAGQGVLKDVGIQIGTKSLAAALKKVPGRFFIEINKKVGFRLITKAGEKGVINMGKLVPFAGGPIGGTIDAAGMKGLSKYALRSFPEQAMGEPFLPDAEPTPEPESGTEAPR